ncbi:MAG: JAB domain-containing protein [Bacteroidota bacterium]
MKTHEQTIPVKVDEVKLVYQTKTPASQRAKVTCSEDAKNAFLDTWEEGTIEHHESFRILLLNRANRALGIAVVSNGGISGTVIDVRQIFQAAVKSNCSSIIACHNHPSGNRQPSDADQQITKKISEAGKIMDIKLLDHLILTPDEGYFSFADEGLL